MDFRPRFQHPIAIALVTAFLISTGSTPVRAAGIGDYAAPFQSVVSAFENVFAQLVALVEPHHTVTVEISPAAMGTWHTSGKTASAAAFNSIVAISQPTASPTIVHIDTAPKTSIPPVRGATSKAVLPVSSTSAGAVLGTSTSDGVVTQSQLQAAIQQAANSLRQLIYANAGTVGQGLYSSGGYTNNIALTNRIDSLSNVSISNATVHGLSGLATADIPNLSSQYLPLSGGTVTGGLIVTSSSSGGQLSLGNDQGAQFEMHGNGLGSPYFDIAQNTSTDYDFRYQLAPANNLLKISASSTPSILNIFGSGNIGIGNTNKTATISATTASNYGLVFGNISSTPGLQGGPLGSNALAITNGSVNIWNNYMYGWGGTAAALCIQANIGFSTNCQVSGGFASPSGVATYTGRDLDAVLIQIVGTTNKFGGSLPGTFDASNFYPTTPLTAAQVAKLRVGMVIDTNDSPTPYSGIISGWDASGGSYVTVQGWYLDGTTNAGTPLGTAATISPVKKLFGLNIDNGISTGNQETQAAGIELSMKNDTGAYDSVNDLPRIWGYDGNCPVLC